MELKKNMSNTDRIVRLVIVALIAGLKYAGIISGTLATVLIVLAVIFVFTSIFSICPLYLPFKLSTRKEN
ncbi:MAG: DUF2892 domain-containing protein [Anaerolineae bacterium]|nr:DUF2892 domain-containing protein [Anaerolineae bacterium]